MPTAMVTLCRVIVVLRQLCFARSPLGARPSWPLPERAGRQRSQDRTCQLSMVVALLCLAPWTAWGHAFPQRSEPAVGATVAVAPPRVRIWFDGALEAAFSSLQVQTVSGQRVDRGDGRVDPTDVRLLEVPLPPLPPGMYRVLWRVVARDGHRTTGEYTFTIQPGP